MVGGLPVAVWLVVGLLFLSGCAPEPLVVEEEVVSVGFCPTMAPFAERLRLEGCEVSLVRFGSAAAALSALDEGRVDAVLVGRLAGGGELDDPFEWRLRDGLTLVGDTKRFVSLRELRGSRVHTAVSEGLAREYLPEGVEVVFHDSSEAALREGLGEMALIPWSEFADGFELVIPVDAASNKVERFRLPVLYSYEPGLVEDLAGG